MTLLDVLKALIYNKLNNIPNQVILTNFNPQLIIPEKKGCPSCGATLRDIAAAQRIGCPDCYTHYSKELLPVLIHAHKSCEHVGKIPKNRILSKEEQIKLLELRLKQAIELEKYEEAKDIKTELDAMKSQ